MSFSNLKIAIKCLIPVVIMAIFAIVIAWFGATSGQQINKANTDALHAAQYNTMASDITTHLLGISRARYRSATNLDSQTFKESVAVIKDRTAKINTLFKQLKEASVDVPQAELVLLGQAETLWADYSSSLGATLERLESSSVSMDRGDAINPEALRSAMIESLNQGRTIANAFEEKAHEYADFLLKEEERLYALGNETAQDATVELWEIAIGAIIIGSLLAFAISQLGIVKPIRGAVEELKELADGHLSIDIRGTRRKDEVGDIARTMLVFKENGLRVKKLQEEQEEQKKQAEVEKHRMMNELADNFDASVRKIVQSVSSAATEMQASSGVLTDIAHQTAHQAESAASASERSTVNVQTVAAATEELSGSISEISRQVGTSSQIAGNAVSQAQKTDGMVQGLSESAQKIGEVINLINDIASQTNLLALNATIEAARAGDAGKGFAVVASEVKNLANQTAKATEEIGSQISAVQQATTDSAEAIREITGIIEQINEVTGSIAAAVEEQSAATQEIARNVQEAAAGVQEVGSNIALVNQASAESGQSAGQVNQAANELSQQSEILMSEVTSFIHRIRSSA